MNTCPLAQRERFEPFTCNGNLSENSSRIVDNGTVKASDKATRKYPTQLADTKIRKSAPAIYGMKKLTKYNSIPRSTRPASGGVKSEIHRLHKERQLLFKTIIDTKIKEMEQRFKIIGTRLNTIHDKYNKIALTAKEQDLVESQKDDLISIDETLYAISRKLEMLELRFEFGDASF